MLIHVDSTLPNWIWLILNVSFFAGQVPSKKNVQTCRLVHMFSFWCSRPERKKYSMLTAIFFLAQGTWNIIGYPRDISGVLVGLIIKGPSILRGPSHHFPYEKSWGPISWSYKKWSSRNWNDKVQSFNSYGGQDPRRKQNPGPGVFFLFVICLERVIMWFFFGYVGIFRVGKCSGNRTYEPSRFPLVFAGFRCPIDRG